MMDKRGIIAIALCIMVLVVYQEWVTRYYAPAPTSPVTPESRKDAEKSTSVAPPAVSPATPQERRVATAPTMPSIAKADAEKNSRDIKVETDEYFAVFTNLGARLKSFKFK